VLAVRPEALEPAADPEAVPARLVARQFLGTVAEWDVEASGHRLRLWTDPARAVPDALAVRAARWRWVEDDENPRAGTR
ncbi:MAG: TOBE domain-containing protein, partial [Bacteroidota bacterium]